jgi:4-amino-4-deoxy-L-arabinose transferase-like glycosyltransferase
MKIRHLALALGGATMVSRVPFVSPVLWDHDSVQFALAVERYDLAAHQPHPPGYPLYVALLELGSALGAAPGTSMVVLSVLASGVGACCATLLAAELGGEETAGIAARLSGLAAGVLFLATPVLWFYGELPLVYAVEGGLAVFLAWLVWRAHRGGTALVLLALAYALSGGVRPSTAVLLAPLVLLGAVRALAGGRTSRRTIAAAGGAMVLGVLVWAVPLVVLAGGLGEYRRIAGEHFGSLLPQTSILHGAGWPALRHNLEVLVKWTLQGALLALIIVLFAGLSGGAAALVRGLSRVASRSLFYVLWIAPPLLFFALFHVTKAGYTLVYLPALLVAAAVAAGPALARRPRVGVAVCVLAGLLGAALFVAGSRRPPEQPRPLAVVRQEFNAGRIARFARELAEVRSLLAAADPARDLLVSVELPGSGGAGAEGFVYPWHRHLQWYFPRHRTVLLLPAEGRLLSSRGHRPFRDQGGRLVVEAGPPPRAWLVLSSLPENRLRLPPSAEVRFRGEDLVVVEVELEPGSTLGSIPVVGPVTLLQVEGDLLEVDAHVDVLETDTLRRAQVYGGEVQDGAQTRADERVEGLLRRRCGNRDHRDPGAGAPHQLAEVVRVVNREGADPVADLLRIDVDPGDHAEAAVVESRIAGEGASEVPHADDEQRLLHVETEEGVQPAGQVADVVPHAAHAELSEVGEILADLRRRQVVAISHLLGGDALDPEALQMAQAAQIHRKAVQRER